MQCFYNKEFNYVPNKVIQALRPETNNCSELDNFRIKKDQSELFTQKVYGEFMNPCKITK